jgi:hypothetical protein
MGNARRARRAQAAGRPVQTIQNRPKDQRGAFPQAILVDRQMRFPRMAGAVTDRSYRREFITLFGGVCAAWPIGAQGQDGRTARVGLITPGLNLQISGPGYQPGSAVFGPMRGTPPYGAAELLWL